MKEYCTICDKEIIFPDIQHEDGLHDKETGYFIFFYSCNTCQEKSNKCEFYQDLLKIIGK